MALRSRFLMLICICFLTLDAFAQPDLPLHQRRVDSLEKLVAGGGDDSLMIMTLHKSHSRTEDRFMLNSMDCISNSE